MAGRALLHGWTTCADGLSVAFRPPSVRKACGEEVVIRIKLHSHDRQGERELAAPPALASRQRLTHQWPGERRSFPLVLVVRSAVHATVAHWAVVAPPRPVVPVTHSHAGCLHAAPRPDAGCVHTTAASS